MTALTQAEHDQINAQAYLGTREMCPVCDEPTGNAGKGDGSLYCPDCDKGPFCWACYEIHCPRLAAGGWRYHALDAENRSGNRGHTDLHSSCPNILWHHESHSDHSSCPAGFECPSPKDWHLDGAALDAEEVQG